MAVFSWRSVLVIAILLHVAKVAASFHPLDTEITGMPTKITGEALPGKRLSE